jgi:putative addiction module component (TIGR02574 family)
VTQEASDLLKKALALPEQDRAALAGVLIDSLDAPADASAEEAWNDEIARRIGDIDSGKTRTIPWEELRRRITTKLNDGK